MKKSTWVILSWSSIWKINISQAQPLGKNYSLSYPNWHPHGRFMGIHTSIISNNMFSHQFWILHSSPPSWLVNAHIMWLAIIHIIDHVSNQSTSQSTANNIKLATTSYQRQATNNTKTNNNKTNDKLLIHLIQNHVPNNMIKACRFGLPRQPALAPSLPCRSLRYRRLTSWLTAIKQ